MSRIFEFCHYPELFSCQYTVHEICHIIIYLVIGHCAYHNIIIMWLTTTACHNKIQPLICHIIKINCQNKRTGIVFLSSAVYPLCEWSKQKRLPPLFVNKNSHIIAELQEFQLLQKSYSMCESNYRLLLPL